MMNYYDGVLSALKSNEKYAVSDGVSSVAQKVSPDEKGGSDKVRARDALVFKLCDGCPMSGEEIVTLYEKTHGPCGDEDRSQLINSLAKQGLRNDKPRRCRRHRRACAEKKRVSEASIWLDL